VRWGIPAQATRRPTYQDSIMKISIQKTHPAAIVPQYATGGAACFDLHAVVDNETRLPALLHPGGSTTVRTGLAFEVPDGWVLLVFSRSGHGFKNDARLANCVGVIDSDYRGEVMVKLRSDQAADDDAASMRIHQGDRIAQAMLLPLLRVSFDVVETLSPTERGVAGFGSTGK
jgi:dUTP pyrophosphatase